MQSTITHFNRLWWTFPSPSSSPFSGIVVTIIVFVIILLIIPLLSSLVSNGLFHKLIINSFAFSFDRHLLSRDIFLLPHPRTLCSIFFSFSPTNSWGNFFLILVGSLFSFAPTNSRRKLLFTPTNSRKIFYYLTATNLDSWYHDVLITNSLLIQ